MTGSPQHQLAKWLTSLLQPVLQNLSSNCVSDFFTFVKEVKNLPFLLSLSFFVVLTFPVSSPMFHLLKPQKSALTPFTIITQWPSFPHNIFVEIMQLGTFSVKFSFNNIIHRQIDGVAMGSPLDTALANIFVDYQEAKLFNIAKRPLVYFRYVDDTFAVFNNEEDCNTFLTHLNSLHSLLRFTYTKESNHSLRFLDVLVESLLSEFLISVYRKPTFTGQYQR